MNTRTAGSRCKTNLALLCRLTIGVPDATGTSTRRAEERGGGALHDADVPPRGGGILPGLFKNELEFGEAHGDYWLLFPPQIIRGNS